MKKTLQIVFILFFSMASMHSYAYTENKNPEPKALKKIDKSISKKLISGFAINPDSNFVSSKSLITNTQLTNYQLTNNQLLITNSRFTNNQLSNNYPTYGQPLIPNPLITSQPVSNVSFYPEGLIPSSDPIDSAQYYIAKAQAVIQEVREFKKFVGYLNGESLLSLPVGIHKEIGGLDYDIAIASIKLKPQYAELEVFMTFEMPQNGKVLTFRGKGIKFTKEGGIVGDATLELVADYAINLQGDKSQIILKSGTAVSFDCSGFLSMALNADIKFARSLIVPENEAEDTLSGNVMASFQSTLQNWNDLVVEINMPPFRFRI